VGASFWVARSCSRHEPRDDWTSEQDQGDLPAGNGGRHQHQGETGANLGAIAKGSKLKLRVPAAPGRVFTPVVTSFEPNQSMVWSDGMAPMFKGVRTFTLTPRDGDGSTDFSMVEVLTGVMLPMIKGSLPDFGPPFEKYAADLKREAERSVS
jgi:hypothetical protein